VLRLVLPSWSLRRALAVSAALHLAAAALLWLLAPTRVTQTALVDIELAPPPPLPEALPAERAEPVPPPPEPGRDPEPDPDSSPPSQPEGGGLDAGVDAAPDARPDAAPDARPDAAPDARPDAGVDAGAEGGSAAQPDGGSDAGPDLAIDAGIDAATELASNPGDAGAGGDATAPVAVARSAGEPGDGTGSASPAIGDAGTEPAPVAGAAGPSAASDAGSDAAPIASGPSAVASSGSAATAPLDTAALAAALAAGPDIAGPAESRGRANPPGAPAPGPPPSAGRGAPGVPGTSDQPAVEGAPTTAGTAANLLAYFPDGHVTTALIRFDRLRGTEWATQTERLLRPLPDYQWLFGARGADLVDQFDSLAISTPRPRDAVATTLVARTPLSRRALRELLGRTSPVAWSAATGGLLGRRSGAPPGDQRVFLSPFAGWFVLAQPGDLGALTGAARGDPDAALATGALPPWIAGIRAIEAETGDPRGPAVVVTLASRGKRLALPGGALALGISSLPTPVRVSLAGELVAQGWLVRGNLRFASEADAIEFVATVQQVQRRIAGSRPIQIVIGAAIAHAVGNLAFARAGARVSYATSLSIADARALLAAAAAQLDQYFGRAP
jgi:hypothetical protein